LACPKRDAYEACVDKHALLQRAARLGVHVPRSQLFESPDDLESLPAGFRYPAILKPRRSHFWQHGRWCSANVGIVYDAEDLARRRVDPGLRAGCLVQEYIPGYGEAVFLLTERGEPRVRFAHQRLREKPPTGGQSVLRVSIAPDPELLDWSERLLADLDWSGPAMVEFRRAPDGQAALMEINPRLWGSVQLAIDAGVDFPSLLVDLFLGRAPTVVEPRLGVRTRWLLGDLDHLLICLRHADVRRELDATVWGLVVGFLTSFFDGTRTEVFRPNDVKPFLRELAAWWHE
jgi:predicted ATP-grasp superfamily ATP-dependent carboligase